MNLYIDITRTNGAITKDLVNPSVFHVDDLVFAIPTENDDCKYVHLDFGQMDICSIEENQVTIKLKDLGCDWDDLNEEEGIQREDITYELLESGELDNYVIFSNPKQSDVNIVDFKIKSIGYIDDNHKVHCFKLSDTIENWDGVE